MNKKLFIYILAVFSMLFWGLSFVWVKIVYLYYRPFTVVTVRLFLATILLLLYQNLFKTKQKITLVDIPKFLLLAFFEPFCYFLGESFGMQYVSSTLASIIIATIPVFSPIFSLLFYREKLSKFGFLGLVISVLGIVLLVVDKNFNFNAPLKGILLLLFAVISAIGYGIVAKKLTFTYDSVTIIKYQNAFGFIYFLPFFLIFDFNHFLSVKPDIRLVANLLALTVFASVLAFVLFTKVLKEIGINSANIFTNLIPIFTAVFSFLILKESFNLQKISGIFLVVFGVFISQVKINQKLKLLKIKNVK
ncbi:MAG: DMT family transporter [Exilispira sp.]|jgi:drug/metabolite transporter (DMT)-like permease|nr:DMT family transporter [Exilispira sp.]